MKFFLIRNLISYFQSWHELSKLFANQCAASISCIHMQINVLFGANGRYFGHVVVRAARRGAQRARDKEGHEAELSIVSNYFLDGGPSQRIVLVGVQQSYFDHGDHAGLFHARVSQLRRVHDEFGEEYAVVNERILGLQFAQHVSSG